MDLGGPDFVATMIAINLAVEFWNPLKGFVGQILTTTENRAISIRERVAASQMDGPAKTELSDKASAKLNDIKQCVAFNTKLAHLTSRWLSIASAAIGLGILYTGLKSSWNALLALPLGLFLLWSTVLYLVLRFKVWRIRKTLGTDLLAHVLDGKALGAPSPSIIPDPPQEKD